MLHEGRPHPRKPLFGRIPRHGGERRIGAPPAYWSIPHDKLLADLHSEAGGLSARAAARRLKSFGPNTVGETAHPSGLRLLLRQFANPLIVILVAAAVISAVLKDWTDSIIILLIVVGSGVLGFVQEYRASRAVEELRARVRISCSVLRDGRSRVCPEPKRRAGRYCPAVRRQSRSRRRRVARDEGLFRLAGGADGGVVSGRENDRASLPRMHRSPNAATASLWEPRFAAAPRACWWCRLACRRCSAASPIGCAAARRKPNSSAASGITAIC